MGIFSMRLVEHIPGVSRVYKNAIGYTTKIMRQEHFYDYKNRSFIEVSKSLDLSKIAHGRNAYHNDYIPIMDTICHIGSKLKHSILDPLHKIKRILH